MYKIEKDIPAPIDQKGRRRKALSLTLEVMEIGDSIAAPTSKAKHASTIARKLGIKVRTQRKENDASVTRIWRVK